MRFALPIGGALMTMLLAAPAIASAHEQRDVGKYHFVVGFLNEPTVQNQLNGIDLTITTSADKKPVVGADKTLKAELIVGGNAATMPVTLQPASDESPDNGKYAAYFIPTLPGSYTFHFTGTINGDQIDQKFSSGPNTFDDVEPASDLDFPIKLQDPAAVQTQASGAQSAAGQGRMLGIAGLVLGALGFVAGGAALARGRRS